MRTLLLAAILLSACGPRPDSWTRCGVELYGVPTLASGRLSDWFAVVERLTLEQLAAHGHDTERICRELQGWRIEVVEGPLEVRGEPVDGVTLPYWREIQVRGVDGGHWSWILAHEYCHASQWITAGVLDPDHKEWNALGYDAAADAVSFAHR